MTAKKRTQKQDNSPYAFQSKKQGLALSLDTKIPWTEKQLEFLRLAQDKNTKLIFLKGDPGTGKSLLSVYAGLLALKEKKVSDIVYVRTLIEIGNKTMGFLPGSADEKLAEYLAPMTNKLYELVGEQNTEMLIQRGFVSGKAVNFLRGCQFTGKFVIADEFQNFCLPEAISFLTRIGEFSKVIICGDTLQNDIGKSSVFAKFYDLFDCEESKANGIFTFEFDETDIVRSEILKFIVKKIKEL
jgi:phosphate starvation-inducible protein PhoH